jgi:hypothetical protein
MSRRTPTVAIFCICTALALLWWVPQASAGSVIRGTDDTAIPSMSAQNAQSRIDFLASKLHAGLLRFDVRWAVVEPQRGTFDETYLAKLQQDIHEAAGQGMQVIVTIYGTPAWASDHSLWRYAPPSYKRGVYHAFYPPATDRLADFQAFADKLASTFAGDVTGYECRNEPNLWSSLYPQRTSSDSAFAVRRYALMLTAFSKGIRAGDPHALVIAGATAPAGVNNTLSTSPQRFAKLLRGLVKSSVFDAYSHHPYAIGGTRKIAPEDMPADPSHAVTLGNISTLLKIFPHKPFYLTEYGYYTSYTLMFGVYVSQATQAAYLTRAYRYAARYPQIKALIWFPYRDSASPGADLFGTYSGLVTHAGAYKPSWFAFAGGNSLTLAASKGSASLRLAGALSSASLGGLAGKSLTVSRRLPGGTWRVVRTVKTGTGGAYHLWVAATGRAWFRVAWPGVVQSKTVEVNA